MAPRKEKTPSTNNNASAVVSPHRGAIFDYDRDQHLDGRPSEDTVNSSGEHAPNASTANGFKDVASAVLDLNSEKRTIPEHASPSNTKTSTGSSTPVKWKELPRKDQLIILTLARFAEPLTQTSLQAYMFYMLKSFDPAASDSTIASQAGILAGSFTAAQCLTAVGWGRLADKEWFGRKNVLLVGLIGTLISSVGFGFSKSLWAAVLFRCVGGALNGNVGVMRTMISEIIKEKKYQPKAFLIMPVTFNVGILVGPLLGGWLQDPAHSYPGVFGPGSWLGGKNGVGWMARFPYALPNLLSAVFLLLSAALVLLGLEETHEDRRDRRDWALQAGRWFARLVCRPFQKRPSRDDYFKVDEDDDDHDDVELQSRDPSMQQGRASTTHNRSLDAGPRRVRPKLTTRRIFTPNVLYTFLAHSFLHIHISSFNNLWFLFLSTPRFDPAHPSPASHTRQTPPFSFTGGLGMTPATIGFAIGIVGVIGLVLQFGVYSRVVNAFGILRTFRIALCIFPFTYLFAAFLAVVPTRSAPPHEANGPWVWMAIVTLLFFQVIGRTFVLPITQILVNNCTPHPSVLATVHGIGQSVSSGSRTLGPVVWSWLYGYGLRKGVVGLAWWSLSGQAVLAVLAARFLYEGSGHEIILEGDVED